MHLVHVPSARVTDFVPSGHMPSTLDLPDLLSRTKQPLKETKKILIKLFWATCED
jgi:hypothetical protein